MSAIGHMAGQMMKAEPLRARVEQLPLPALSSSRGSTLWPYVIANGRRIEELHQRGMKLVDVARELGINYNGLRGMYSKYRRAKAKGLI